MKFRSISIVFLLLSMVVGQTISGQNVIVFKNLEYKSKTDAFFNNSPKRILLKEGIKIKYVFKESDKKMKGKVDKILFPFFVIVDNKHYSLKKFETITFRSRGQYIKRGTGPLVFGLGAALAGSAVYMGREIYTRPDMPYPTRVTPLTMATATIGIGIVVIGIDLMVKGFKIGYSGFRKRRIQIANNAKWSSKVIDNKEVKNIDEEEEKEKKRIMEEKKKMEESKKKTENPKR